MNPTERDKAMDALKAAREHLANCESELEISQADVNEANDAIDKIERQFPEVRWWAARKAASQKASTE